MKSRPRHHLDIVSEQKPCTSSRHSHRFPLPKRPPRIPPQALCKTAHLPARSPAPLAHDHLPARAAAFEILDRVADKRHSDELLHSSRLTPSRQATATSPPRWSWACCAGRSPSTPASSRSPRRPDRASPSPSPSRSASAPSSSCHLDRIPAHAALSESVELGRAAGQPHAAGMVNAILRKLTRTDARRPPSSSSPPPPSPSASAIPLWLVERWVADLRPRRRPRHLRVRPARAAPGHLRQLSSPNSDARQPPAHRRRLAPRRRARRRLRIPTPHAHLGLLRRARRQDPHPRPPPPHRRNPRHRHQPPPPRNPQPPASAPPRPQRPHPARRRHRPPRSEGLFDLILCDVPCSGTGTLAATPRSATASSPQTSPARPPASARSSPPRSPASPPAAASSTPPARSSRKRTSRSSPPPSPPPPASAAPLEPILASCFRRPPHRRTRRPAPRRPSAHTARRKLPGRRLLRRALPTPIDSVALNQSARAKAAGATGAAAGTAPPASTHHHLLPLPEPRLRRLRRHHPTRTGRRRQAQPAPPAVPAPQAAGAAPAQSCTPPMVATRSPSSIAVRFAAV